MRHLRVNKTLLPLLLISMCSTLAIAQEMGESELQFPKVANRTPQPFLFSTTTLTAEDLKWSLHDAGSYGQGVEGPFGYEGVSQQVGVKGYLGYRLTVYASAAIGIPREGNNTTSAQRAEIIHDFIGGKRSYGARLGLGVGFSNDFSNAKSLLSRITLSFDTPDLKASGNLLLEHTFAHDRDGIDVITNLGFQYRLFRNLYAGFEAIGQDLEGFWEEDEAEGGAKLMVGPSLSLAPKKSKLSFALCGGPAIHATHSQVTNPDAIRELPVQSGFVVMASVIYNLSGI